jgi:hypothetical protein
MLLFFTLLDKSSIMSCTSLYIQRIKNCKRKGEKNAEIKGNQLPLRTYVMKNYHVFAIHIKIVMYWSIYVSQ